MSVISVNVILLVLVADISLTVNTYTITRPPKVPNVVLIKRTAETTPELHSTTSPEHSSIISPLPQSSLSSEPHPSPKTEPSPIIIPNPQPILSPEPQTSTSSESNSSLTTEPQTITTPELPSTTTTELLSSSTLVPDTNISKWANLTPRQVAEAYLNYENLDGPHKFVTDLVITTFKWAQKHLPIASIIFQVGQQMTQTQLRQIRGAEPFLEILGDAIKLKDIHDKLRRYNVTGERYKNATALNVALDIASKYNLSIRDIPIGKLLNFGTYVKTIPGLRSLMTAEVDGVPFIATIVHILSPVITDIPLSQLGNITVIRNMVMKVYKIPPYLLPIAQNQLIESIKVAFKWADTNFPIAVRVLQVAKQMTDTQLSQIPGADAFLHIISEALRFHTIKERLKEHNITGEQYKNMTADKVIKDIVSKHNFSINDIPINKIKSYGELVAKLPGVRELTELAITTQVDGVPFFLTLINLLQPVFTQIPVSQLTNTTVIRNLTRNAYDKLRPYMYKMANDTLDKLHKKARFTVMNLTELNRKQVLKVIEINRNLSGLALSGVEGMARNMHNFTHNTLERVSQLNDKLENLTNEQISGMKGNLGDVMAHFKNITHDPYGVVTGVGRAAKDLTVGTVDRMWHFSKWLQNLTWDHLYDMGVLSEKARRFSVHSVKQLTHLGKDVVYHTYSSVKNLSEITKNMSPIQMLSFSSVEELIKSTKSRLPTPTNIKRLFDSMPSIGDLPGIRILNAIFKRLPNIGSLGFNQLLDFLNKFRTESSD